jgi:hypothetical protein
MEERTQNLKIVTSLGRLGSIVSRFSVGSTVLQVTQRLLDGRILQYLSKTSTHGVSRIRKHTLQEVTFPASQTVRFARNGA